MQNNSESAYFHAPRTAQAVRETKESKIEITLNLDGSGTHDIHTGIGFFDHMLAHIAVHGLFDLDLHAAGDLDVDAHHTIEDTALTLGRAFDQALGDRRGIVRIAASMIPMDESLARVVIDLSGRPYCVFQAEFDTPAIGSFPTSLVRHFFESFAGAVRANIHARVEYGYDDHHRAEALFKGLARALAEAARRDPRRKDYIPSTKGTLNA